MCIWCAQLWCTTAQSWSNNLPSYPPDNHHSSDVVCWRGGGSLRLVSWCNVVTSGGGAETWQVCCVRKTDVNISSCNLSKYLCARKMWFPGSAEALIRWCGKLNQLSSTWFPNVHILFLGHGSKLSKLKLQNETEHELPSECATPSFMR